MDLMAVIPFGASSRFDSATCRGRDCVPAWGESFREMQSGNYTPPVVSYSVGSTPLTSALQETDQRHLRPTPKPINQK